MKVSIITTCYNRENTIGDAIESVLSQNYKDIEYVVIDGNSQDQSVEIISQYKEKIHTLISERDRGIYDALNKGIKNCKGDIIGILHSDDVFYGKDTISKIVNAFQYSDADVVYANGMYIDDKDIVKRVYTAQSFKKELLYWGWIPLHTTIFVKREVFEKYGLYRENFSIASDYEISLRWFTNEKIKKVFLDEWVVKMRLGGKSTDISQQKKKSMEDSKIIGEYKLWGKFTLLCKIIRKIPQYILPRIIKYK